MWNKHGNDAVLRKAGGREDVIIGCSVQPQWGKSGEKGIWKEWVYYAQCVHAQSGFRVKWKQ